MLPSPRRPRLVRWHEWGWSMFTTAGPVEFIEIAFPGNRFNGAIVPALRELVDSGAIRILDLLFIKKDAEGNVQSFELSALAPEERVAFDDLEGEIDDLLSPEDILLAAEEMPNNSSAGLLVWENLWAARFADAVRAADGVVLTNWRIPQTAIDAAFEAQVGE